MATMISTRTDMLEQVRRSESRIANSKSSLLPFQLFQRLEQESEQRALQEQDYGSHGETESSPRLLVRMQEVTEVHEESLDDFDSSAPDSSPEAAKERRRGSISISRFGQATTEHTPSVSNLPSTRPSRSSSIVSKPAFYQLDMKQPHVYTNSADSFASLEFDESDPSIHGEDQVESSMFFEPGKRSISKAISRRLSRAKEPAQPLPSVSFGSETVVIGIAVEEATIEHSMDNGETHSAENISTTEVYSGTLRSRRSMPGLYHRATVVSSSPSAWVSKAKDMTSRFRRRSLAALTNINAGTVVLR